MVTLMRFNIFLIFVLIFAYLLSNLYIFIKKDNILLFNSYLNIGFFISILFIISLTMFPISTNLDIKHEFNLIPFKTIIMFFKNGNITNICTNVMGNTLLFIPLGFFCYIKFNGNFNKTLKFCIFTTIFVECIQILLPMRLTDVDDLILNTLGGFIGILIAHKLTYKITHAKKVIE